MKALVSVLLLLTSVITLATPVDGKIVYKLPSGELAERQVSLTVPTRGEGEVILSGNNFEWRTENFWTVTKNKRTVFYASFKTDFMQKKSTQLFKGTYLKGTNKILYYGNFYKAKGHHDLTETSSLEKFNFSGAFKFQFLR